VKGTEARRSILHVDLDPFFVSVERSLDASLRGRPVVVGGDGTTGVVAAASAEARALGVRPGQSLQAARRACPDAVFRPGDLEAYARVSDEITRLLLDATRRVERPSADEAYADLTPEGTARVPAVRRAEDIKDALQRRLGLDASIGLASSRLAARVASSWARPRGMVVVIPGYETSFLARQPLAFLPDLPPHLESALERAGFATLGDVSSADDVVLEAAVGPAAAALRAAASGQGEAPIAIAAPPSWLLEEAPVRDPRSDRDTLLGLLDALVERACRRLRPHDLRAESLTVEVRRAASVLRRSQTVEPGVADAETAGAVLRGLAEPLLEPVAGIRTLAVRFTRLARATAQPSLFPRLAGSR
jgi:DNA polymerase-4